MIPVRLRLVVVVSASVAALWSAAVAGGQARTPSQRLQDAIQLLETKGDARAAIPVLREVASGPDRAVAARAWLALGQAYETLGESGARSAYLRIEREYADQPAAVGEARARRRRLEASGASPDTAPSLRRIWTAHIAALGPPTPDGRWLPILEQASGDLFLRSPLTGEARPLSRGGQALARDAGPGSAAIAPDGRTVAFASSAVSPDGRPRVELRVTRIAGADARTVLSRDGSLLLVGGWTPDMRQLLVLIRAVDGSADIVLVTVESGESVVVAHLADTPESVALSPDGRFVAYDAPQADGMAARDISVRGVPAGPERVLVAHRADDRWPVWMLDGQRLAFTSDRTGATALWDVPLAGGAAAGEPRLVRAQVGRVRLLGLSDGGVLYFSQLNGPPESAVWETWVVERAWPPDDRSRRR